MVCQNGRYGHLQHSRSSKAVRKVARRIQVIDHQKVVSKAELDNMNNQISILVELCISYLQLAIAKEMR